MPSIQPNSPEAAYLQSEIHKELVKRGTAEEDDPTMAEYIAVMCVNKKTADQINDELLDLVGSDFDSSLTPWLFTLVDRITNPPPTAAAAPSHSQQSMHAPTSLLGDQTSNPRSRPVAGNSRLLTNALAPINQAQRGFAAAAPSVVAGQKRGFSPEAAGEANKRRLPTGPRGADGDIEMDGGGEGRDPEMRGGNGGRGSLLDRMGGAGAQGNGMNGRGGAVGRGMGMMRGGGGGGGGRVFGRGGFGAGMGMNGGFPNPYQQQLLAHQMMLASANGMGFPGHQGGQEAMALQAMMMQQQEQMGMMMRQMQGLQESVQGVVPVQQPPPPPRAQPAQKLGSHTISARHGASKPKKAAPTVPDIPTSEELCKFATGCTHATCPFSHPSPAATATSGMVLKKEVCPQGKGCKDPECPYSHVSPAQVLGGAESGEKRVLCKFPVCTNPTCPFRHEDSEGNLIPPPALSRPPKIPEPSSDAMDTDEMDHDDLDVRVDDSSAGAPSTVVLQAKLDGALGDGVAKPKRAGNGKVPVPCRFGSGCTNKTCKFEHPTGNGIPCNFGKKCFKVDCPYSHPAGRTVGTSTISSSGFTPYKGSNKSTTFNAAAPTFTPSHISDRKFGGEDEAVEKIVPGEGVGRGEMEVEGEVLMEGA